MKVENEEDSLKLLREVIKMNESACAKFYAIHANWLFAVCKRYVQNSDDAQDVLQEAFILIFKNLNSFKEQGSLKGWLRRVVVNSALTFHRKNKKDIVETNDFLVEQHMEISLDFMDGLDLEELNYYIDKLPPGRKQVFCAYAIEGYTHKEIGELLQISEGTSKSQYFDAKKELKKAIEHKLATAKVNNYE